MEKHNQKNHAVDGINFRLNKLPKNGSPPTKKPKEFDSIPATKTDTPMDTNEKIEVAAMRAALASDMIDQNLQVPNPKVRADAFLQENYPGRIVVNVPGDGACMPRAACVPLFKNDSDWIAVSRAINKFIRENWYLIKTECQVMFPLELKIKNSCDIAFQNEVEYLEFLKTNDAIYIWRDHHDLIALSELLKVKITVISIKGEYVETVHEVVPVSGAKVDLADDRIVLCHTGDHYRAIVPPVASIKKDTGLLQKIAKYISDVNSVPLAQASLPPPVCSPAPAPAAPVAAPGTAPVIQDGLQKRLVEMEKMMAEMQSRLTCAQIDIQVLKNENQDQNRSCAEHFKELEGLKLSDMKNKGIISELRQMEKRIEEKFIHKKTSFTSINVNLRLRFDVHLTFT